VTAPVDERAVDAARNYDRWFDREWGRYASRVEQRALDKAVGSSRNRSVVDVGCGTGRFTGFLDHHATRVIGLDRDLAMLSIARPRVAGPLVTGDALALPFRDASFDLAVALTVLEFVADPAAAVAELARVTRPGGSLVIGALNTSSPWGLTHRHEFTEPPWNAARFLTRHELYRLATPHGVARIAGALHAPGTFPGLRIVGPVLELLGRAAPALGAFQILVVHRS
jgi:ubiquinone/menaquinone biosynthesis C-methylase UbiE